MAAEGGLTTGEVQRGERPLVGGPVSARQGDTSIARLGASTPLPPLAENVVKVATSRRRAVAPIMLARAFVGRGDKKEAAILAAFVRQMTGKVLLPDQAPWAASFINAVLSGKAPPFLEFGTEAKKPRIGDVAVFGADTPTAVGFFMGKERENGESFVRVLTGQGVRLFPVKNLLSYRRPPKLQP